MRLVPSTELAALTTVLNVLQFLSVEIAIPVAHASFPINTKSMEYQSLDQSLVQKTCSKKSINVDLLLAQLLLLKLFIIILEEFSLTQQVTCQSHTKYPSLDGELRMVLLIGQ